MGLEGNLSLILMPWETELPGNLTRGHLVSAGSLITAAFPFSWRISASEALKHPWLSDPKLHSRLSTQVTTAAVLPLLSSRLQPSDDQMLAAPQP